jgi:hypothetical protein
MFKTMYLSMLVNKNLVPVRILNRKMSRAFSGFICFSKELNSASFKLLLKFSNIREAFQIFGILILARIEGKDIFFKHPLEQSDNAIFILHDQPILIDISSQGLKPQVFVKRF